MAYFRCGSSGGTDARLARKSKATTGTASSLETTLTLNGSGSIIAEFTRGGNGATTTYTTSTTGQISVNPSVGNVVGYDGQITYQVYTYTNAVNATFKLKSPSIAERATIMLIDLPHTSVVVV